MKDVFEQFEKIKNSSAINVNDLIISHSYLIGRVKALVDYLDSWEGNHVNVDAVCSILGIHSKNASKDSFHRFPNGCGDDKK